MKLYIYLANLFAFAILGFINLSTQTVANEVVFALTWVFMCLTIAEFLEKTNKIDVNQLTLIDDNYTKKSVLSD